MPYQVLDVQPTPNPNAMKFVLDRTISQQPASFFNAESARQHPVASQLFSISGVTSVLLLADFVTLNKQPQARWARITPRAREILKNA